VGSLSLTSSLTSNGGGGANVVLDGGGGAGGGVLLHAGTVAFTSLSAGGGGVNLGFGGGGGGGRIALAPGNVTAATINTQVASLTSSVNGGDSSFAGDGKAGVLTFRPDLATVQSTQSLNVGITPGQTGQTDARIEVLPRSLTVEAGGTATLISPVTWDSGGVVSVTGGALNVSNSTTFSTGSTLNWSGGSLNIDSGQTLAIDGGVGSVTVGGRSLSSGATLRITNGGRFESTNYFDIGNFVPGTLLVDGPGSAFTTDFIVSVWGHNAGVAATVTFSNKGAGSLLGGLAIANNGGQALVNIQSSAALNLARLIVGGAAGSSATINISNAALSSTGTAQFRQGATVNLSSGSISFGDNTTFTTGSKLNWNSGTVIVASGKTLTIDGGAVDIFQAGRAVSNGSTLRVINGGRFSASFVFDIANAAGSTGSLSVDGPGSLFEVYSSFGRIAPASGNAATVTIANSARAHYDEGLQIAASGGTALVNINNSASLSVASLIVGSVSPGSTATINLNGGSLISTGPVALRNGVVVNYSAGSLRADGTLVTSGNAQVLLSAGGNKVLRTTRLNMSGTSKIDLADNDMIIDVGGATPLATVRGYIITGRNGGDWLGNALTTSSAALDPTHKGLGVADNAVLGLTSFGGQTVDSSSVLVKFTYLGDADLDGDVDVGDLGRLATAWQTAGVWTDGDFDYSGSIDVGDLGLLATNWQAGAGTPLAPKALPEVFASFGLPNVSIPEPACMGFVLIAVAQMRGRHRKLIAETTSARPAPLLL
jgi:hypothetical protein